MPDHILDISFHPKGDPDGTMVWSENGEPTPSTGAVVHRGEKVQWRSDEGDLEVTFETDEPFRQKLFKASKQELTSAVVVHMNAPHRSFVCTVRLRGKTKKISGVDVQPPP